jgi:hypothetical protein
MEESGDLRHGPRCRAVVIIPPSSGRRRTRTAQPAPPGWVRLRTARPPGATRPARRPGAGRVGAEDLPAQPAARIDEDRGRRPLHRVRLPGARNGIAPGAWRVDAHREEDPVLVQERAERLRPHRLVVLEHGVEPTTASGAPAYSAATRCACGSPRATQPRQTFWNARRSTTRSRSPARLTGSDALNHRVVCHSGANCGAIRSPRPSRRGDSRGSPGGGTT